MNSDTGPHADRMPPRTRGVAFNPRQIRRLPHEPAGGGYTTEWGEIFISSRGTHPVLPEVGGLIAGWLTIDGQRVDLLFHRRRATERQSAAPTASR